MSTPTPRARRAFSHPLPTNSSSNNKNNTNNENTELFQRSAGRFLSPQLPLHVELPGADSPK